MSNEYYWGTGRRKTAVARVRLEKGNGQVLIDKKESTLSDEEKEPLVLIGQLDKVNLSINVTGGGFSAQKEAIKHGISHALVKLDSELRPTLRKAGFLTRDDRMKERKKYGLKGARRAPQWSKR